MSVIYVTSTADSGTGTLRQAAADAQNGDVILFDPTVFPAGQTTPILLSSYIIISRDVLICGGEADGEGGYTSGATITRYVKRLVNGVETEIVIDDEHPALEGETVLFHVQTRVAIDGQAVQSGNAEGDFDGWSGSRCLYFRSATNANNVVRVSGVTLRRGLSQTNNYGGLFWTYTANVGESMTVYLSECAFLEGVNDSGNGGAFAIRMISTATFDRCEFRESRAKTGGGFGHFMDGTVSEFNDCSFASASCASNGGALSIAATASVSCNRCVFDDCVASSYGGVIYATGSSEMTLNDCRVVGSSATTGGGAIEGTNNSRVTANRCVFVGNESRIGGCAFFTVNSFASFNNCVFSQCVTSGDSPRGGACYANQNAVLTFDNCEFSACSAQDGGAVRLEHVAVASFNECSFNQCVATRYGGGINSLGTTIIEIGGGSFDECSAQDGGAAYIQSASVCRTRGTIFRECNASSNGGGIYVAQGARLLAEADSEGNKTRFVDCYYGDHVATGTSGVGAYSLIFHDFSDAVFENCAAYYERTSDQQTVRYFTTNANSGDGSFRAVLSACNANDVIAPDPTVFPPGSTITIQLSSYLDVTSKNFYVEGRGRKIVFDGQGACRLFRVARSLSFTDCEFVNGYVSGSAGAAIDVYASGVALFLTRCRVAGSQGYRIIPGGGNNGGFWVATEIVGNSVSNGVASNFSPVIVGSTIAGNYKSGAATFLTVPRNVNSIDSVVHSEAGFVSAPPDTLAAENWNADLWKSWDLSLTSESPFASGAEALSEIDALVAGDDGKYDYEGFPRKPNGCIGAYEDRTGTQFVTTIADSGAGSLRQAISDAQNGDAILFSFATFPKGKTTTIPLSSQLTINKSVTIFGGGYDSEGNPTSGATKEYYVYRVIDNVRTRVVISDPDNAQEGETVLFSNICRVAIDGQNATQCLVIDTTSFSGDVAYSGLAFINGKGTGGGCYLIRGSGTHALTDCSFNNCSATTNNGGAIYTQGTSVSNITGCCFYHCSSGTNAGAIYAAGSSQSTLVDCCFDGCTATSNGGVIYAGSTSRNTLNDCVISNCSATNGGGVYSTSTSQNTLTDCSISNCSANAGGCLYSTSTSQNVLTDCVFDGCSATTNGGAIVATSNSTNSLASCIMRDCQSNNGGGFYSGGSNTSALTNCSFDGCTATTSGGALYLTTTNQTTITGCAITNCTATTNGGAIFANAGTSIINDCTFDALSNVYVTNTSALTISGGITTIAAAHLNAATITIADGAVLNLIGTATIGAANISSPTHGYLATAEGVDISSATLTNITVCGTGAGVTFVSGIKLDERYLITVVSTDPTKPVLIEYQIDGDDEWLISENAFVGTVYKKSSDEDLAFRVFDGESFFNVTVKSYGLYRAMKERVEIGYIKATATGGYLKATSSAGYLQ